MKRIIPVLALTALAAVPATAPLQGQTNKQGNAGQATVPHTVHSELMVFQDMNYNGEDVTVETPSSTIHTDWPIRSIAIHPGDSWQICGRPRFREPCIVLNRSVPDARMIGIENQIGSARLAPTPAPARAN